MTSPVDALKFYVQEHYASDSAVHALANGLDATSSPAEVAVVAEAMARLLGRHDTPADELSMLLRSHRARRQARAALSIDDRGGARAGPEEEVANGGLGRRHYSTAARLSSVHESEQHRPSEVRPK